MIVGNNGMWGLEKHPMQAIYGWDMACDLQPGLRYDDVVKALGGAGETVTRPGADRSGAGPRVRERCAVPGERAHRPDRRLPADQQPRLTRSAWPTDRSAAARGRRPRCPDASMSIQRRLGRAGSSGTSAGLARGASCARASCTPRRPRCSMSLRSVARAAHGWRCAIACVARLRLDRRCTPGSTSADATDHEGATCGVFIVSCP